VLPPDIAAGPDVAGQKITRRSGLQRAFGVRGRCPCRTGCCDAWQQVQDAMMHMERPQDGFNLGCKCRL